MKTERPAAGERTGCIADAPSEHRDLWAEVEIALLDHFYNPDLEGARAFYAAMAAHDLPGQPIRLAMRAMATIAERLDPAVFVTIEDLVTGDGLTIDGVAKLVLRPHS